MNDAVNFLSSIGKMWARHNNMFIHWPGRLAKPQPQKLGYAYITVKNSGCRVKCAELCGDESEEQCHHPFPTPWNSQIFLHGIDVGTLIFVFFQV